MRSACDVLASSGGVVASASAQTVLHAGTPPSVSGTVNVRPADFFFLATNDPYRKYFQRTCLPTQQTSPITTTDGDEPTIWRTRVRGKESATLTALQSRKRSRPPRAQGRPKSPSPLSCSRKCARQSWVRLPAIEMSSGKKELTWCYQLTRPVLLCLEMFLLARTSSLTRLRLPVNGDKTPPQCRRTSSSTLPPTRPWTTWPEQTVSARRNSL